MLLDGILFLDGVSAKLVDAKRTIVEHDPHTACPVSIRIDVIDDQGRTAHVDGTDVNRFVVNLYPSLLVWECQRRDGLWTVSRSSVRTRTTGASTTTAASSDRTRWRRRRGCCLLLASAGYIDLEYVDPRVSGARQFGGGVFESTEQEQMAAFGSAERAQAMAIRLPMGIVVCTAPPGAIRWN